MAGGKSYPLKQQLSLLSRVLPIDNFGDSFGAASLGGLYDCHAYGYYSEDRPPYEYLSDDWMSFPQELVTPVKVSIDKSVYERLKEWRKTHPDSGRITEVILRFARIVASMSGKKVITAEDITPALVFSWRTTSTKFAVFFVRTWVRTRWRS